MKLFAWVLFVFTVLRGLALFGNPQAIYKGQQEQGFSEWYTMAWLPLIFVGVFLGLYLFL